MEFSNILVLMVSLGFGTVVRGEMSDDMKEMARMLHDQCLEETGVAERTIQDGIKGNIADDPKLKCYMKCLFIQMGVMDADTGELDFDAFAAVLPEDIQEHASKSLAHCKDKVGGADGCEKAYSLNVCLQKFDPAHFMMI